MICELHHKKFYLKIHIHQPQLGPSQYPTILPLF